MSSVVVVVASVAVVVGCVPLPSLIRLSLVETYNLLVTGFDIAYRIHAIWTLLNPTDEKKESLLAPKFAFYPSHKIPPRWTPKSFTLLTRLRWTCSDVVPNLLILDTIRRESWIRPLA